MAERNVETTHMCPPDGSGLMPCCSRAPLEVSPWDRVTRDRASVTCQALAPAVEIGALCGCENGPGPQHMWGPMECPPKAEYDHSDRACMCPWCHSKRLTYCALTRNWPSHPPHHIPECPTPFPPGQDSPA